VQHVADPQLVAPLGFESAEHLWRVSLQVLVVELAAFEVALQGALGGRPAGLGAHGPGDLRGAALGFPA
jgi:hypothetical protein